MRKRNPTAAPAPAAPPARKKTIRRGRRKFTGLPASCTPVIMLARGRNDPR